MTDHSQGTILLAGENSGDIRNDAGQKAWKPVPFPERDRQEWTSSSLAHEELQAQPGRTSAIRTKAPPPEDRNNTERYRIFRRICDDLLRQVSQIDEQLRDGVLGDDAVGLVVEIDNLLEQLYRCPWGEGQSLQCVVVAIQSQINNARWTVSHARFLNDTVRALRSRYLVNGRAVEDCYGLMEAHGLDPFRGTVSEPDVIKRYRVEEVTEA